MTTYIYGASDDLIEIEGDDLREEFYYANEPMYIGFSTGAVVKIEYDDDGDWRIKRVTGDVYIHPLGSDEATRVTELDYSDLAEVPDQVDWVIGGKDYAH